MQNPDVLVFLFFCLLLAIWILLPLAPAWATYRITPDQKLGLRGPLEGLTIRASGAFAAYCVILVASGALAHKGLDILSGMQSPTWTVKADVKFFDRAGAPVIRPEGEAPISIRFKPDIHRIGRDNIQLRLPGDPRSWPLLQIHVPLFGGTEVDFSKMKQDLEIDEYSRLIVIKKPIVVRELPANLGFGASGR